MKKIKVTNFLTMLCENKRFVWFSLFWILLLMFFTYTPLFVAAVSTKKDFLSTYYLEEGRFIGLFVNFGLVCMLMFDYASLKRPISYSVFVQPVVILTLALIVMAHADLASRGLLEDFVFPITCKLFGIIAHSVFLLGLWWMKCKCLIDSVERVGVISVPKDKE